MGTPCQIDVKLAKPEGRKNATIKDRNGSTYKAPVFKVSVYLYEIGGVSFFCTPTRQAFQRTANANLFFRSQRMERT